MIRDLDSVLNELIDLAFDFSNDDEELNEKINKFEEALVKAKNDGLDMNERITSIYFYGNEDSYFEGDIDKNIDKLKLLKKENDIARGTSVYKVFTILDYDVEANRSHFNLDDLEDRSVLNIVRKVYGTEDFDDTFTAELTIKDKKNYFVGRYMFDEQEESKLYDFFEDVDNEENYDDEVTIKGKDLLTNFSENSFYDEREFTFNASQFEDWFNTGRDLELFIENELDI